MRKTDCESRVNFAGAVAYAIRKRIINRKHPGPFAEQFDRAWQQDVPQCDNPALQTPPTITDVHEARDVRGKVKAFAATVVGEPDLGAIVCTDESCSAGTIESMRAFLEENKPQQIDPEGFKALMASLGGATSPVPRPAPASERAQSTPAGVLGPIDRLARDARADLSQIIRLAGERSVSTALGSRVPASRPPATSAMQEAVSGLRNMGFGAQAAEQLLSGIQGSDTMNTEQLVRAALARRAAGEGAING